MRVFLGFDDTDTIDADRGTGKLARWFEQELPDEVRVWGVMRQQLLVHDLVPYTSHNSSACVVMDAPEEYPVSDLVDRAVRHLENHFLEGSDPGICMARENEPGLPDLIAFGNRCTHRVVTQKEALAATSAPGVHLSGHGGTNDGIIGAAAAIGLTASGWSGRFIEFGCLRDFSDTVTVGELERQNIKVVSLEKNADSPLPEDTVLTYDWVRPRLLGDQAVLLVQQKSQGVWENIGAKARKDKKAAAAAAAAKG